MTSAELANAQLSVATTLAKMVYRYAASAAHATTRADDTRLHQTTGPILQNLISGRRQALYMTSELRANAQWGIPDAS